MRANKIAETIVATLNEMLLSNEQLALLEGPALKSLDVILEALAPGYSILIMHDMTGRLAGFAHKYTPHTSSDQPAPPPDDDLDGE